MVTILLVGASAGVASTLLYVAVASGAGIAVILLYFLPLPIVIAALGFSHWAGLFACASAALLLATFAHAGHATAFLVGLGLPAWWLGYLSLLARPAAEGRGGDVEWYPIGRLVLWAAAIGAMIATAVIVFLGTDEESFRAALKKVLEEWLRARMRTPTDAPLQIPGIRNLELFLDIVARTLLPAAAVSMTTVHTLNLWLAARIVKISNRLARPWPDIPSMRFPALTSAVFLGAVGGCFLPGLVGMAAIILVSCLVMAFAMLGLTVVHFVTRGLGPRTMLLVGLYAAIAFLSYPISWPLLAMSLVGFVDTAFDLRRRLARTPGPPAART